MKPLREQGQPAATRLADANQAFAPAAGEQAAAWARLRDRLPGVLPAAGESAQRDAAPARDLRGLRARRGLRLRLRLIFGAGTVAALASLLWLLVGPGLAGRRARPGVRPGPSLASRGLGNLPQPPRPSRSAGTAPATAAAPTPAPREAMLPQPPADDQVAPPASALPSGRSLVTAGVRARLAPHSAATVRAGIAPGARVVALNHGTLDIEIAPAFAPSSRVEVQVAAYRLETEGGRFRVSTRQGKVDLVVHSGKLIVWSSRRVVAQVVAGERWSNLATASLAAAARAGEGSGGGQQTSAAGQQPAPSALPGAPAPTTHAPAPTPAIDAPDCARLTRRGAIDEALACFSDEARQPGLVGELALMELARIRRDVKGDLAGAESALAEHRRRFPHGSLADEAAGARIELLLRLGRAGDALAESERLAGSDGLFWRAVCLGKLGRAAEAARTFDAYLARPDGKHRAEATRMRQEIAP